MTAEKARWRERFRAQRRAADPAARAAASERIAARLATLIGERAGRGAVALFWPLPGEVDLRALAESLRQSGAAVALPAVVGVGEMVWRRFEGAEWLVETRWGVREPDAEEVSPGALSLVAVPGLAFGRDGTRLGYGGGFYDRALAETEALRVGVSVSEALVDAVPSEPHDARLHAVVTDAETAWVGRPPRVLEP